jgi:hypothetical protein
MWSAGDRGRNQVCLMIDEESMRSVVDHPAPGYPDYERFSQSRVPRAYVVVADCHYHHTGTTPEPGLEPGETGLGPDTMKVAISDVLVAFLSQSTLRLAAGRNDTEWQEWNLVR